jgi:hypothetical protein
VDFKITKELYNKMLKSKRLATKHRDISKQIDDEMESIGFDIERIRNDDSCGYVDMIDYGIGNINVQELLSYKKRSK